MFVKRVHLSETVYTTDDTLCILSTFRHYTCTCDHLQSLSIPKVYQPTLCFTACNKEGSCTMYSLVRGVTIAIVASHLSHRWLLEHPFFLRQVMWTRCQGVGGAESHDGCRSQWTSSVESVGRCACVHTPAWAEDSQSSWIWGWNHST